MSFNPSLSRKQLHLIFISTALLTAVLAAAGKAARAEELLIGTSGTLSDVGATKEKAFNLCKHSH